MPTVPVVRQTTVRDEALPGVRVSTNVPEGAFGGGAALEKMNQVNRGLNEQVQNIALKEMQNADDIRIQDADLQMSRAQTDIQTKMKSMVGKDAIGAPDYVDQEWKKQSDKIRESLSTDNQRRSFDKIRAVRSADLYSSSQNHVSIESKKYDVELTESYVKNAQNVAATNFLDNGPAGQVEQSVFQQQETLKKFGARNGIPDELLKNKIATSTSETYSAVIEQMLANHADQVASDYYKQKKDFILPEHRTKIEKAIEEGVLLGEGQREADKIFTKYSVNRNQAFEKAKDIKDPDLRKQTEEQLDRMFTRQSLAQREQNYRNYQLASQLVEQNQNPPGNLVANLTADQRRALQTRLKQVNAGVEPNTDWNTYYSLKSLAANNKNSFVKTNLIEYRHTLADTEFKDLVNLQSQLSKNDVSAQANLNGFRTTTQIIDDTLLSAGIDPKSKNSNQQKRVARFRRMVDENIQILQDQTGKKAKSEDVQKIADNLLINTIDKSQGFINLTPQKRVFELEFKDVPLADRENIIREMRKRNKVPTERSILQYYIKKIEFEGPKYGN